MAVASNWASRRHHPPGSDMAVNIHKANAMGAVMEKGPRKVHVPGLSDSGTGGVKVPGLANTKR